MKVLGKTLLILMACGLVPAQAQTVRMGTLAPKGSTWELILREMGFQWKQETRGRVQLRLYSGGVVGDESEMIRKMRIGQLHAAAISAAGLAEIDRASYALVIPLMFASYGEWDAVRRQINPLLEERLRERGFVVLAWSDVGEVHFFSREPLQTPQQLKKMKLAASTTDAASVEILKWAGFNPVPISTLDSVTGLQTGLIDALYLPIIFAEASNLYRHAPHMADLKWAFLQGALLMDLRVWNRIPEQYREVILQNSRQAGEKLRADNRQREEESLQAMIKRGLKVWEVRGEDLQQWHQAAAEAYPRIRGELVPEELFDRVLELRNQYRKERGLQPQEGAGSPANE